jgi:hypothetical protein
LEKKHSDVGVQKMEISSVDPVIDKTTLIDEEDTIPEVNRENSTPTIRESQATKTPY